MDCCDSAGLQLLTGRCFTMLRRLLPMLLVLILALFSVCQAEENTAGTWSVRENVLERDGQKISGDLYLPDGGTSLPLVICCHGFGGNRDHVKAYAEAFARNGIAAYAFDFIGGGYGSRSDGTMKEMSVLTEAADLCAVMDAMRELPEINPDQIFLLGASQGGFVSSYVAGIRPDDVAGVIALYPAYVLQDNAWKQTPDPDNIPETISLMGVTLGGIYNRDAQSFDIYDIIKNYPGKVLIIHGTVDSIAPISYSERAAEVFPDAELIRYEGANHGFMGQNLTRSEDESVAFVREILNASDSENTEDIKND